MTDRRSEPALPEEDEYDQQACVLLGELAQRDTDDAERILADVLRRSAKKSAPSALNSGVDYREMAQAFVAKMLTPYPDEMASEVEQLLVDVTVGEFERGWAEAEKHAREQRLPPQSGQDGGKVRPCCDPLLSSPCACRIAGAEQAHDAAIEACLTACDEVWATYAKLGQPTYGIGACKDSIRGLRLASAPTGAEYHAQGMPPKEAVAMVQEAYRRVVKEKP